MKITRQNYEIWFIDFIDGNLNPADEAMLRKFVRLNPDLANELEDIADFKFVPELNQYPQKDLLKQNPLKAIDELSKFEQLSIAYLENDINEHEQAELNQFVQNSDRKKKAFKLLQETKLTADTNIVYKERTKLKKLFVVSTKTSNYKLLYRVAAVFVLLLGLTIIFKLNTSQLLIGKQLSRLETSTTLRKPMRAPEKKIFSANNEEILVLQNQLVSENVRLAINLPEKLMTYKCESISSDGFSTDNLAGNINNALPKINSESVKLKPAFAKSLMYVVNTRKKAIGAQISATFKRNFRYKKINTDDGRTLIALKAGDMEYIVSRKQKNK